MDIFEMVSVPIIVIVVYCILTIYKSFVEGNETLTKIIPVIAAGVGAVLGIVAFYLTPNLMLADNLLTAVFLGLCSGLAATGTNQVYKQLAKNKAKKTTK